MERILILALSIVISAFAQSCVTEQQAATYDEHIPPSIEGFYSLGGTQTIMVDFNTSISGMGCMLTVKMPGCETSNDLFVDARQCIGAALVQMAPADTTAAIIAHYQATTLETIYPARITIYYKDGAWRLADAFPRELCGKSGVTFTLREIELSDQGFTPSEVIDP